MTVPILNSLSSSEAGADPGRRSLKTTNFFTKKKI
jgi:hypothetical protein